MVAEMCYQFNRFDSFANEECVAMNVKLFGAKGNGIVDDTTSIQHALNSGKPIFFPEGKYLISRTLKLIKGNVLYSNPRKATIKAIESQDFDMFMGEDGITIEGLNIDGSGSGQTAFRFLNKGNDICFNSLHVKNVTSHGIYFMITNGKIFNNVKITDCNLFNTGGHGIGFYGFSHPYGNFKKVILKNIHLDRIGNVVDNSNGNDFASGIMIENMISEELGSFSLSNIYAEKCWENGIYLSRNNAEVTMYKCECNDNGVKPNTIFGSGFRGSTTTKINIFSCFARRNVQSGFFFRVGDTKDNYGDVYNIFGCESERNGSAGFATSLTGLAKDFSLTFKDCTTIENKFHGIRVHLTGDDSSDSVFVKIKDCQLYSDGEDNETKNSHVGSIIIHKPGNAGNSGTIKPGAVITGNYIKQDKNIYHMRSTAGIPCYLNNNIKVGSGAGFLCNEKLTFPSQDECRPL